MGSVYSNEGLEITVDFNPDSFEIEWKFSIEGPQGPFTKGHIETIIEMLQRSLTPKVEVKI